MILARVKGNVVATAKHDCFIGHKIMIVHPIDENGNGVTDATVIFTRQ